MNPAELAPVAVARMFAEPSPRIKIDSLAVMSIELGGFAVRSLSVVASINPFDDAPGEPMARTPVDICMLPAAPLLVAIHVASVWVPFTSESKEAIADYDEISKEIRLALQECGRRLGIYLRRKKRRAHYTKRRDVFHRYIGEVVDAVKHMADVDSNELREALDQLACHHTAHADLEFDEQGNPIQPNAKAGNGELNLPDTIIVARNADAEATDAQTLFGTEPTTPNVPRKTRSVARTKKKKKVRKKRVSKSR